MKKCLFFISLPALVMLLSGCRVDQNKDVAQYRAILHERVPNVVPLQEGETLTMPRALALASQADEGLASRGEEFVQALIARNRALANFLPTVSFQPSFVVAQPSSGRSRIPPRPEIPRRSGPLAPGSKRRTSPVPHPSAQ